MDHPAAHGSTPREEQSDALAKLLEPFAVRDPRDGDCTGSAVAVTRAARDQRLPAVTALVLGWNDAQQTILSVMHQVTVCHGLVLDATARQFTTTAAAAWIAPIDDYLTAIADIWRTRHATLDFRTD